MRQKVKGGKERKKKGKKEEKSFQSRKEKKRMSPVTIMTASKMIKPALATIDLNELY